MRIDENQAFVGSLIVAFFVIFILWLSLWTHNRVKLEECEATLPRDQNCVLIAVPEEME
jgi:hypothetical protein